jgi:F0F1-type ATP synthase delta subunit
MEKLENLLNEIKNTRVDEPNIFKHFMLTLLFNSYVEDLKKIAKRLPKYKNKKHIPKSKLLR